jgi:hypothetical protein
MKARELETENVPAPAPAVQPPEPEPSSLTVYRAVPDLEAWDRSAAEIESHSRRPTAAAQRAAERAAERALREKKGGLARRLFRG